MNSGSFNILSLSLFRKMMTPMITFCRIIASKKESTKGGCLFCAWWLNADSSRQNSRDKALSLIIVYGNGKVKKCTFLLEHMQVYAQWNNACNLISPTLCFLFAFTLAWKWFFCTPKADEAGISSFVTSQFQALTYCL